MPRPSRKRACVEHVRAHLDVSWRAFCRPTTAGDAEAHPRHVGPVTAIVDGAAADTESVVIGGTQAGSLRIHGDGWLFTQGPAIVGSAAGGTATVTGEDAQWLVSGSLAVDLAAPGMLEVLAGASVDSGAGFIGLSNTSTGVVTVSGDGSNWHATGNLRVGDGGTGTLNIQNGGAVNVSSGSSLLAGVMAGANGDIFVTGTNSALHVDDQIILGDAGIGSLTIEDGGTGSSLGMSYVGNQAGALGTVIVSGDGSSWTSGDDLAVGMNGEGNLSILNGGTLEAINGSSVGIGIESGGAGSVLVSGTGSQLLAEDQIVVGYRGDGTLTVADHSKVEAGSAVILAQEAGSSGILNIASWRA